MADPVTLVILLAAGEAASPTASAMARGARDAFAGTVAEVRETPGVPTDADAIAAESPSRPDAVAELIWRDPEHRSATLRVHLRQSHRWIERSFAFAASDPAAERGRTLGFAVASILPEAAAPATPAAPAPATATATATAPTPAPTPAPAPTPVAPGGPRTERDSAGEPASSETVPFRYRRLAVDLLAAGAMGIADSHDTAGDTAGGGAALEWFVLRALSLRLGAIERVGSLDVAAATMSTLVTSAGIALHPWQPTPSQPFTVSFRADYVLVRESATHIDSDDTSPVTAARWVSGVDTFVDASLLLSSQIAAVAGIGVEDVGAPTYVYFRDVHVATLPVLRAVIEGGFQLRF